MQASFDMPDRIEGLVVGDVAPVDYSTFDLNNYDIVCFMSEMDIQSMATRENAKEILMRQVGGKNPNAVAEFLLTNLSDNSNGKLTWNINLRGLRDEYEEYARYTPDKSSKYDGPVNVIYGTRSEYMPPRIFPEFKKYFPNIDLDKDFKPIVGGHWIHLTNPELFLLHVKEFMDRLTK